MKILINMILGLLLSFSVQAKEIVLTSDNTLILDNTFNRTSVSKLMEEATEMDSNLKSGYPMYLFLYTPGGSIQAGLELYEFLGGLNRPVHTVTLFAASMGFQTVQHLGKRYILKYGVLMAHKARGGFTGEFGGGISQLDSRYGLWLRRIALMDKQTVMRTKGKQTLKSYTSSYTPELWLNGQEAVNKGYADEIVTIKCAKSMNGYRSSEEDFGFFKVKMKLSKCPIKTSPIKVHSSLITNKGEMDLRDFLIENGKFGDECEKNSYATKRYYEDEEMITVPKDQLCSRDKTLTLKKIREKIEEKRKFYNRNLRDYIVYSY